MLKFLVVDFGVLKNFNKLFSNLNFFQIFPLFTIHSIHNLTLSWSLDLVVLIKFWIQERFFFFFKDSSTNF
jgi:hypothetical protein